jgi:hypothetical protein
MRSIAEEQLQIFYGTLGQVIRLVVQDVKTPDVSVPSGASLKILAHTICWRLVPFISRYTLLMRHATCLLSISPYSLG